MKWTKKDIKTLCSQLDSFWLTNRPLAVAFGFDKVAYESAAQKVRETLATRRVDVVLAGIRGFERMHSERYSKNCETLGNELARFGKTLDDEFVQRLIQFARDEDASLKAATALRERIQREGLPLEVIAYDPIK